MRRARFWKILCAAVLITAVSAAPIHANATFDQAVGYGTAWWLMDKVFGGGKQEQKGTGTCMVLADSLNSVPLQALMTARHMTLYAVNTEPRSREIIGRLTGAMHINNLLFMDYARTLGRYWDLMDRKQRELDRVFDSTAVSDSGLTRQQYLDRIVIAIEKPNTGEIRITYTYPIELKKKDCCVRNTKSVYLSVSMADYGAAAPDAEQ